MFIKSNKKKENAVELNNNICKYTNGNQWVVYSHDIYFF